MATTDGGSGWTGWALLCGVPATLGMLFVNPTLAVLLGVATFVAWKIGAHQNALAECDRHSEEVRAESEKRERLEKAVISAAFATERCVAVHGWQAAFRSWALGTSDFETFDCFGPNQPLPAGVYAIHLICARKEWKETLDWVRDLRRRGRIPALAAIPPKELLVTLDCASDTEFDPAEAVARYCVDRLFRQIGDAAGMKT